MEPIKIIDFITLSATTILLFNGLKYSVAIFTGWISAAVSGGYARITKKPFRASPIKAEIYQFLGGALFYGVVYLALLMLVSSSNAVSKDMGEFTLILAGIMLLAAPSILHFLDKRFKGNKTTAFP